MVEKKLAGGERAVQTAGIRIFPDVTELPVTETAEIPVISQAAHAVEKVVVGKEATYRTETIRDTVRRTDFEAEQITGQGATKPGVHCGAPGNTLPVMPTGGYDADGSPDTRDITEKIADAVTGYNLDDKTGKPVN